MTWRIRALILLLALVLPGAAWAGAAPARLDCVATTKAPGPRLRGWVPYQEHTLDLTLSSGSTQLHFEDDTRAAVVSNLGRGVFTLSIFHDGGDVVLYAVPDSVRKLKQGPYASKYLFAAGLEAAPDPGGGGWLQDVPMSCTWSWQI